MGGQESKISLRGHPQFTVDGYTITATKNIPRKFVRTFPYPFGNEMDIGLPLTVKLTRSSGTEVEYTQVIISGNLYKKYHLSNGYYYIVS